MQQSIKLNKLGFGLGFFVWFGFWVLFIIKERLLCADKNLLEDREKPFLIKKAFCYVYIGQTSKIPPQLSVLKSFKGQMEHKQ